MPKAHTIIRLAGFLLLLPGTALTIGVLTAAIGDVLSAAGILSESLARSYGTLQTIITWLALIPLPFMPLIAAVGFGVLLAGQGAAQRSRPWLARFCFILAGLLAIAGPMLTGCLASTGGGEGAIVLTVAAVLLFGTLSLTFTGLAVLLTKPLARFNALPLLSAALLLAALVAFIAFFNAGGEQGILPAIVGAFGLCWLLAGWQLIGVTAPAAHP